jgi:hypothetical protein
MHLGLSHRPRCQQRKQVSNFQVSGHKRVGKVVWLREGCALSSK